MTQEQKDRAKEFLRSIAVQAVNAQYAIDNNDFESVRDFLDDIESDLGKVNKIGIEALEEGE